ncbi:MAG: YceD family protein [bacterium]
MKISLIRLAEGLHTLNFVAKLADLGLENHPNLGEDAQVTVELEKRLPHYFLKNHVRVAGRFLCDRCAKEIETSLFGESRSVFSSDEEMAARDEEVHLIAADAKELDITDDIRDTLALSLPMKLLCSEDCRGLCAGCGANLNEEPCRCAAPDADPRWEALRKLI